MVYRLYFTVSYGLLSNGFGISEHETLVKTCRRAAGSHHHPPFQSSPSAAVSLLQGECIYFAEVGMMTACLPYHYFFFSLLGTSFPLSLFPARAYVI